MINRSPPFTRQRARDAAALQQQQNGVLGNLSRPNNTANTQNRNVSLNNRVDGELLESEESMGSNEIRNALLNVAAPVEQNGQQAARNEAGRGGGNFEQQHVDGGLRIRLQNVGRNNGQEWRIRNENLNDGHRIFNPAPQNLCRTKELTHPPLASRIQFSKFNRNQSRKCNHNSRPNPCQPKPVFQQGFPGFMWGYPGQFPYGPYPNAFGYPPQQNFGYVNPHHQQPPTIFNQQFPPPVLQHANYAMVVPSQQQPTVQANQQRQVFQPVAQQQNLPIPNRPNNFGTQNVGAEIRQTEEIRGPGMDQVAYALIMSQIPSLKGNEGAEKIKEFFKRFDANTAEWSNAKRITSLESKLFGRAERAFKSACSTEPYRYESIKREMFRQLEETDAREWSAFDQIMTGIRRKNDEDLDSLAERVITLVRRAYPGLTDHLVDDYAIKHLIRTFDNSELALSLEMGRTPGMTFDHFVGMAARAEATQRATRRMASQNAITKRQNEANSTGGFFNNSQTQQTNDNRPKCYNCGKLGHVARNCFRRQAEQNGQMRNFEQSPTTGANCTPMPSNPNTNFMSKPEQNTNQHRPQHFQSRNFLKQNFLVEGKEVKDNEDEVKCTGVLNNEPEMEEFFKIFWEEHEDNFEAAGKKELCLIGKIMTTKVTIFDQPAISMMDGGAQVSLIKAEFLKNILESQKLEGTNLKIWPKTRNVVDINGKRVECYGIILLPVVRRGCEAVEIMFHITDAPVGHPILLGTNALGLLGFKIFDAPNGELVEFECADNKSDSVRVIYNTLVEPYSTKFVEFSISPEFDDKNVLITPKEENDSVRIESSVDKGRKGKVITSVTNFSHKAVILKQNEEIAEVEEVKEIANADDCLEDAWLYHSVEMEKRLFVDEFKAEIGQLNEHKHNKLESLLHIFANIFAFNDSDLTQTEVVKHHIDTDHSFPIKKSYATCAICIPRKGCGHDSRLFGSWYHPSIFITMG
ncbi:hypothetical protein niasHT_035926 [Heterodera trifolii]|uniref:CCHC-type domain-containing protein n=1 Tax=Heterodera trifolii TaxID=157864 RepID=A0ABD2IIC4_9BILA